MTRRRRARASLVSAALAVASAIVASATLAASSGLWDLSLPSAAPGPWRFTEFPIVAWWAPPGTARREDFERYRDAGFTLHATNPDEGFQRALDHVEAVGLRSLVFREHQGFGLTPLTSVDFPRDRDTVVGWITGDEPEGDAALRRHVELANRLVREDPTRRAFFNLLSPDLQGPPGTERVVDLAVRNGLGILSYDAYAILRDGRDDAAMLYRHLETFRALSLRHRLPFWAFALVTAHGRYRRPSESDLRWQHYSNLAYGAKGLWYFTYWAPSGWPGWDPVGIVDPATGAPTELYDAVKRLNAAVRDVGPILLALESLDVVHTRLPPGQRAFVPGRWWIAGVRARDALIGFFRHADGTAYAMVVNKLHGAGLSPGQTADTIELELADGAGVVEAVSWLDGAAGPLVLHGRRASLRVAGGTGVLLRATPGVAAPPR